MKYAIISDIHANLTALEGVIADARSHGVERFVCLGDVVGYGPMPAETLALVRKTCYATIAGNHDDAVSGRGDASTFIDLAKDAVERHRAALSEEDVAWLRSLPYVCDIEGAVGAHGDMFDPKKFYYILDEKGAEANFAATDFGLAFVGHTHEPAIFLTGRSGKVYKTNPQDFTIEDHKRYIVNPGSVGYPRDCGAQCYSSYVIYDSSERTVTFRYLPFQVSSVMQRGVDAEKGPSRRRIVFAACAAAALVAVAALAAWLFAPKPVEFADDPALVVETRAVKLDADAAKVSANLELAKESSPLVLKIEFETPSGAPAGTQTLTVSHTSRKGFKVPAGSAVARFTLMKARGEDAAKVQSFEPGVVAK